MSNDKPRRLGRGLEALLAGTPPATAATPATPAAPDADRGGATGPWRRVPIGSIRPNPYQPRQEFRPEELSELEASLRATGLLQPISVRPSPGGEGYELIAGERRLRAATSLGWTDIPAVVHEIDDRTLLTLALVENLQRSDLNPVEEAEGYRRLTEEFGLSQTQVAEAVGKDRSTVANLLRLLGLPAAVRRMLQQGELTQGHARALLALNDEHQMVELAREIVARGMTVREVEARVRDGDPRRGRGSADAEGASAPATAPGARQAPPEVRRLEDELRRHLQTDVRISLSGGERGTIAVPFYSAEDLERILDLVLGERRERL